MLCDQLLIKDFTATKLVEHFGLLLDVGLVGTGLVLFRKSRQDSQSANIFEFRARGHIFQRLDGVIRAVIQD